MREIKFRAVVIDDDGKERFEYNVWPTGPSPGMRHLRGFVDNGGFWMDCIRFEQFTGLKDKNGKEIYEGDILKYEIPDMNDNPVYYIEEVVFINGGFELDNCPLYVGNEIGEVVGNIYENPELLNNDEERISS